MTARSQATPTAPRFSSSAAAEAFAQAEWAQSLDKGSALCDTLLQLSGAVTEGLPPDAAAPLITLIDLAESQLAAHDEHAHGAVLALDEALSLARRGERRPASRKSTGGR